MIVHRDYKVPGGKLLRVEIEVESGVVLKALVRGDFFAHPEEAFEAAEADLVGLPVDRLCEAALALFAKTPLRLFGATPADMALALEEAAARASGNTIDSARPGEPGDPDSP
jgi:lipoate-protein ligase A